MNAETIFGKKVEVIVLEIGNSTSDEHPAPLLGKKILVSELFDNFGVAAQFPLVEEIRAKAWASKW